jgi:hypothetical protein
VADTSLASSSSGTAHKGSRNDIPRATKAIHHFTSIILLSLHVLSVPLFSQIVGLWIHSRQRGTSEEVKRVNRNKSQNAGVTPFLLRHNNDVDIVKVLLFSRGLISRQIYSTLVTVKITNKLQLLLLRAAGRLFVTRWGGGGADVITSHCLGLR